MEYALSRFFYPNVNEIYQIIIKINKSFCSELKMYIYFILILKVRKWFTMNIVLVALRLVRRYQWRSRDFVKGGGYG